MNLYFYIPTNKLFELEKELADYLRLVLEDGGLDVSDEFLVDEAFALGELSYINTPVTYIKFYQASGSGSVNWN